MDLVLYYHKKLSWIPMIGIWLGIGGLTTNCGGYHVSLDYGYHFITCNQILGICDAILREVTKCENPSMRNLTWPF